MGVTPFLAADGVGGGQRGGGVTGGAAAIALMAVLLQHGADVSAQGTGTKTYSLRNARSPSTNEGMTALHEAVQTGRADLVRHLLEKGANPEIADSNGRKAIDLVLDVRAGNPTAPVNPAAGAGRGRGGGPQAVPASAAEIRAMLENAASRK